MPNASQTPSAPAHLRPETKVWYESVVREFTLEPHHLHLLRLACEALDRAAQAREVLDRDGITVTDARKTIRAHPCVQIERDARIAAARLIRELDLDASDPHSTRPPALRSNRRRSAAALMKGYGHAD